MPESRRNFCKNSVYIGLGLSFFPSLAYTKTHETISKNELILTKNGQKVVKVNGQIRYEDLSPVKNATIEVWHNNSERDASKFEYRGKIISDSEGNYSFETDFPEKYFEERRYKMRRIFFKIKQQNGEEILTKLYFGSDGKACVDGFHVEQTPEKFKIILPKTKFEDDLFTIQFDIYLKTKVVTNVA